MNTCQTCKWWKVGEDDLDHVSNIINPLDHIPIDSESWMDRYNLDEADVKARYGHVMRRCTSPRILFYQRPGIGGACVVDGSNYHASLLTSESFGCTLHEQ